MCHFHGERQLIQEILRDIEEHGAANEYHFHRCVLSLDLHKLISDFFVSNQFSERFTLFRSPRSSSIRCAEVKLSVELKQHITMFFLRRHVYNDLATINSGLCLYGYPALLQTVSSDGFRRRSRRKIGCLRKYGSTGITCPRLVVHPSITMKESHPSCFSLIRRHPTALPSFGTMPSFHLFSLLARLLRCIPGCLRLPCQTQSATLRTVFSLLGSGTSISFHCICIDNQTCVVSPVRSAYFYLLLRYLA